MFYIDHSGIQWMRISENHHKHDPMNLVTLWTGDDERAHLQTLNM